VEHAIAYVPGRAGPLRGEAGLEHGLAMLDNWYRRYCQRQALRGLDDHMLTDIGITRAEADREARKPFWVA